MDNSKYVIKVAGDWEMNINTTWELKPVVIGWEVFFSSHLMPLLISDNLPVDGDMTCG